MQLQKKVAAIHDISGLGKCSLTAALPVLSAAGVSVGVLPTAVLSTQTGGLNNYTYRDLTPDLRGIMNHWNSLDVRFDAIYSGFLGSWEQIDIVLDFIKQFSTDESIYLCDPAMADNGKLYDTFNIDYIKHMRKLCMESDIIVPNFTEASLLLGCEYKKPPYSKEYVESLVFRLSEAFNVDNVVLTGVEFDEENIGAAAYSKNSDKISYSLRPKVKGMFHSTGDLFASSLLGAILNGFNIDNACEIAIDFTVSSIIKTVNCNGDSRFGLCFEKCLPDYIKNLELI